MSMTIQECNKCLGNDDKPCSVCPHYLDDCDGKDEVDLKLRKFKGILMAEYEK